MLKRLPIWIVVARVHEPARVSALDVALERGGQMNRSGHRPGCRIHLVSCVNGYSFDFHLRTLQVQTRLSIFGVLRPLSGSARGPRAGFAARRNDLF